MDWHLNLLSSIRFMSYYLYFYTGEWEYWIDDLLFQRYYDALDSYLHSLAVVDPDEDNWNVLSTAGFTEPDLGKDCRS